MLRSGFALILAGTFATGCSTMIPFYPDSWAGQVKAESGACPAVDGEYQNAGEWFAWAKYGSPNQIGRASCRERV